jgi:hypothetical protein
MKGIIDDEEEIFITTKPNILTDVVFHVEASTHT